MDERSMRSGLCLLASYALLRTAALGGVPPRTVRPQPTPTRPVGGAAFVPPAGWLEVPPAQTANLGGMSAIGMWLKPNPKIENFPASIKVERSAAGGLALQTYAQKKIKSLKEWNPSIQTDKPTPNPDCPKASEEIPVRLTLGGAKLAQQLVVTINGGSGYVATYTRGVDQEEASDAIAAVRSLCPD